MKSDDYQVIMIGVGAIWTQSRIPVIVKRVAVFLVPVYLYCPVVVGGGGGGGG